jgi:hypothetical protein
MDDRTAQHSQEIGIAFADLQDEAHIGANRIQLLLLGCQVNNAFGISGG